MYKYERLSIFTSNLSVLLVINVVIATILVMADVYGTEISDGKLNWLLLLYVITGGRFLVHYVVSNENKYKLDFHFIGVIIAGLAWASFPYLFHQYMAMNEIMFTLVIFCGMSAGSVTLLSSDLRSALAYVSLTVFPYSYVLITGSEPSLRSFGVMGVAYGIALCITAVRSSRLIFSFIDNHVKLEALASNLEIESKNRANQISTLEQRDMLTGLFNRKSFISVIALKQAKTAQSYLLNGFVHIDIEKLHIINHNYGHQYGDHIISEVGRVLLKIDKLYGTSSARYGNDEFTVHINACSDTDVRKLIDKIKKLLTVYFQLENIRVKPDYHIGYYICDDSVPISIAMRNAYLAVIKGKKTNIRVCGFDKEIEDNQKRNEYLRHAIKTAIDTESFYMNFQPIVGTINGKIHAFEALVRWELEEESVSPAEFISIAEEHGLIVELGQLVLKMSIDALTKINDIYPEIAISINVSVIQFEDDDFLDYLQCLISRYSVNPNNIHLEITETAMITDIDKITQSILYAKDIGVMISVDDFGTGFSSIAVLRNLQVDYIKIDKSYIDNICQCEKEESIVSAVTKMAHTIGTEVIAEGVESQDQLALVAQSDVDYYQGYLFSKPVPFEGMLTILGKSV